MLGVPRLTELSATAKMVKLVTEAGKKIGDVASDMLPLK